MGRMGRYECMLISCEIWTVVFDIDAHAWRCGQCGDRDVGMRGGGGLGDGEVR